MVENYVWYSSKVQNSETIFFESTEYEKPFRPLVLFEREIYDAPKHFSILKMFYAKTSKYPLLAFFKPFLEFFSLLNWQLLSLITSLLSNRWD